MLTISLAGMAIATRVVRKVIGLEDTVVLDDPPGSLGHVRAQDGGGKLGVIVRGQRVAQVMQQCRNHQFLLRAVAQRTRGRLQRMLLTVDRVAGERGALGAEVVEHAVGDARSSSRPRGAAGS